MSVFTIVVTTSPFHGLSATANELIEAIYATEEHTINGVFFYQDGVLAANKLASQPSDEYQFVEALCQLKTKYNFDLHLCISAAEKRGMTDDKDNHNIHPAFTISGLGEMVELSNSADRVIQL
ncbi:sulfurtransferase complex subunit TusD [Thalassotalea euphylliae]|uniref:sulfurtransferase complex subunit TusD n=1 Tax=Thalassotalea euphylliae TaxID=1655234 RepID=UPI003626A9AB